MLIMWFGVEIGFIGVIWIGFWIVGIIVMGVVGNGCGVVFCCGFLISEDGGGLVCVDVMFGFMVSFII